MASGRITLESTIGTWAGYIDWSSTPNIEGNYSTVTATLYTGKTNGEGTEGNTYFSGIFYIGSETSGFSYPMEYPYYSSRKTLTVTVSHDSNGNGSVLITAEVYGSGGASLSGHTLSCSTAITLDTIARASTISANKTTVQMLTPLILSIDRKSSSFKHNLYYWDSAAGSWVLFASQVEQSYSWTVPDLVSIMPDAASGNLWIQCVTYSGSTNIGSNTITLTMTAPDASIPSIDSNTATMGTGKTISCQRNSTDFIIKLTFSMGDKSETIANGKFDSYNWSPSYEYAKTIPNLTYGTGTLTCITYNDNTEIGRNSISVKLIVPENSTTRPKFPSSGLTISVVTELTGELAGFFIQGRTGAKAEFTAESDYSTIQSYRITIGSVSASGNPAVIDVLINDGDVPVTARVTDARGFSTTVQTSIHVESYQKPKITPYTGYSDVICERAKETGELSSDGTLLAIKAGMSFSSFTVNGTELNACVLRYRHKVSSAENFSDWVTLLGSGDSQKEISVLVSGVVPSTAVSYNVEMEAADSLGGKHSISFQIMTSHISFVLYDGVDGAGFGKFPEEPHVVDIASHMTLLVRGRLVVLGSDWEPLSLASGVSESSYQVGRVEDCKYQVKDGNHVFVAFNCSFVHTGQALTVNGGPIPEDNRPARTVYGLCAVDNGGTALVRVNPDGFIQVEWVKRDGETGDKAVLWIDGYIDYWT